MNSCVTISCCNEEHCVNCEDLIQSNVNGKRYLNFYNSVGDVWPSLIKSRAIKRKSDDLVMLRMRRSFD
ncbi:Penicillin-binding protein 1A [Trichinella pseudospiralis]